MMREPKIHFLMVLGTALLFLICSATPASAADISSTSVTNPYITIDPIGNHTIGEVFFINGTTNLPVKEKLTMDIVSYKYIMRPHMKHELGPSPRESAHMPVISISLTLRGTNRWSVNVTDIVKELLSGEYFVDVSSSRHDPCDTPGCLAPEAATNDVFTLFPAINGTTSNVQQITVQSTSPVQPTTSAVTVSSTKQSTPLPLVLPIAVLTAIVILRPIKRKKGD